MKRYAKHLMMVIAMILTIAILPSCSNDDDEPSNNSSIVGTWEFRFPISGTSEVALIRYTFNKNGTMIFYTREYETEYDYATGAYTIKDVVEYTQTGNWSVSGDKLTVEGYDEDGEYYKRTIKFYIKGKELTIYYFESDGTTTPMTLTKV